MHRDAPEKLEARLALSRLARGQRRLEHLQRTDQHALLLGASYGGVEPFAAVSKVELAWLVQVD
eukprot:scaffold3461_cov116-Isochrysis_galbana.AAC.7